MPKANKVHVEPPPATLNEQFVAKEIGECSKALSLNTRSKENPLTWKNRITWYRHYALRNPRHLPIGVKMNRVAVVNEGGKAKPFQRGKGALHPEELSSVVEMNHMWVFNTSFQASPKYQGLLSAT